MKMSAETDGTKLEVTEGQADSKLLGGPPVYLGTSLLGANLFLFWR